MCSGLAILELLFNFMAGLETRKVKKNRESQVAFNFEGCYSVMSVALNRSP